MSTLNKARIEHLGQTGLRIDIGDLTVLVDPYLSNSVQELEAPDLVRQVPIPYQPHELTSVDWPRYHIRMDLYYDLLIRPIN